ncbi:uncharacterized protein LOC128258333 isoform X1 [Drosophila gunungcola]|uniref:uncharacterized protein LOC128258333 isoform X1 n=1 Tax=Drosophila gunungcola TaxID=103775 RepID=UPI0022E81770|nr:uncharacterized protein LOC128258333 isoform X1 [Drosophila gunungcola]
MAILESCCFWKDVRSGSFACAIYTLVYFGFSTLMFLFYLLGEQEFLLGNRAHPTGESLLEKGDVTVGEAEGYWSGRKDTPSDPSSCSLRAAQLRVIYALRSDCDIQRFVTLLLDADGAVVGSADIGSPAEQATANATLDLLHAGRHAHRVLPPGVFGPLPPREFRPDCRFHLHHGLLPTVPQPLLSAVRHLAVPNVPLATSGAATGVLRGIAAEKLTKSQQQLQQAQQQQQQHNLQQQLEAGTGSGKRRRILGAASPLITSQRLTNFSTITEEEEQQSRTDHPSDQTNGEQLALIPIITLACSPAHCSDASSTRH